MTDPDEFEVFVKNYQDMVFTTAIRLLGNQADAEDISQAVFMKAYDHYEQIGPSKTAGGWLKTVARNLSLNHLSRYRARWRFFSEFDSEESDAHFADSLAAPDTMEQSLNESDYREMLSQALLKLPSGQRVPLVLFHMENLAYEEIADKLGVSLSKVKTDIHRGRAALKKFLTPSLRGDQRWQEEKHNESRC
ncbi:MAG: sigma-70 family RNA polymerase sigma factor [Verrucomicrobia subdivision 3 bacterium]|nr:sigma-70 family RNA polymerase sigma factor [Limisphaerales bacterium]